MATFTVSIEISVDAESETPLREIALEGWTRIAELQAPIVQVVDDATGTTHVVDFEEGDDLPSGYRWADAEETERIDTIPGALLVTLTTDSNGTPYTEGEADWAVPE